MDFNSMLFDQALANIDISHNEKGGAVLIEVSVTFFTEQYFSRGKSWWLGLKSKSDPLKR